MRVDRLATNSGGHVDDGIPRELDADDCRSAEHHALFGSQAVQARDEEGLNARRHGQLVSGAGALLADHREHLLDEERVAAGGVDDALARVRGLRGMELELADERLDQLERLALAERSEQARDRVELPARPSRPQVRCGSSTSR